ncbi:MAG: UvrB/UvrC motif-containing protein [Planctomycetes bacterium]|nr:UvrB/UvrC motif-containing protein [Planctomycetota bacterium]
MLCEACHQSQATVHLAEISQANLKKETHLCEACAAKKGVTYNVKMSIEDLLGGLLKAQQVAGRQTAELEDLKCPECGLTYAEFAARARFGCAHDYTVFSASENFPKLIERVHGRIQHTGKTPTSPGGKAQEEISRLAELRRLETDLASLVQQEFYEKAAAVRDRIKQLKDAMEGGE